MEADTLRMTGVLYLIVIVLGIALLFAWIVLPFAVIGTKPLLRELIAETRKTRALFEELISAEKRVGALATSDHFRTPGITSNRGT